MRNRSFAMSFAGLILVLTLACSYFPAPTAPTPQVIVVTATPPVAEPQQPTEPPQPAETVAPPPATSNMPAGLVVSTGDGLTFYDKSGAVLFKVPISDTSFLQPYYVHIAGAYQPGSQGVPVIYYTYQNSGSLMWKDANTPATSLQSLAAFVAIAGAPGQPVFAYSTVDATNMQASSLYVGSVSALSASPILRNDGQGDNTWPYKPLRVKAENGQASGVWYTTVAYGIGGDIVFEPRKGLYYLDVSSGSTRELLGGGYNPVGLSPDQTWVAYVPSATPQSPLTLFNLQTGATQSYPLIPDQDQRGAGDAVISPGNQYVAWMEGAGWMMAETPTFHTTVRLGDLNGNLLGDFPAASLSGASGLSSVQWAEPVTWLDDQTLIIMVRGEQWDQTALVKLDVPSKGLSYFGQGTFIGLLYP
jgi:hypothetical protein